MTTETRDLSALVDLMKRNRVLRLRMEAPLLEIELSPLAFALPTMPEATPAPEPIGVENGGEPTEEQILMWSAPGPLPKAEQPEATNG